MPNLEGQPVSIIYPDYSSFGPQGLQVERVQADGAIDVAADIQGLMRSSYSQLFVEGDRPLLARELVEQVFDPGDYAKVGDQAQRIIDSIQIQSSQYWAASIAHQGDRSVIGIIKTSPSKPKLLQAVENMYVDDIAVDPAYQKQGVGRVLLRTAIRFGGFRSSADMICDTFMASTHLNQVLVEHFGMLPGNIVKPPYVIGDVELPQRRLVMRGAMNIGKLATRLEKRFPELRVSDPGPESLDI